MRCLAVLAILASSVSLVVAGRDAYAETVESQQADFRVVELASGLDHPWGLAFLPEASGGGILITERPGRLRLYRDGRLGEAIPGVPEVAAFGQGGLLDVALHPEFADNGWVYLSYAARGEGGYGTRVSRARFNGRALHDLQVIYDMDGKTGSARHFGSRLVFAGDGSLFVSVGERGDPERAQDPGDTAGSILRLNDDGAAPPDNPFAGRAGHDPRVYAYGVRNPQGLALDPETGALWEQEHGPRGGDEVNRIEAGANYGWPRVTYGIDYSGATISERTSAPGIADPLYYWDPSIAPSGMAFYAGEAFPDWQGDLFVGSLKFRLLVRLELDGNRIVAEERLLEDALGRIREVRVGPDGLVYLLTDESSGSLFRLEPAG